VSVKRSLAAAVAAVAASLLALAPCAAPAQQAAAPLPLKIGLIMSFSGPGALLGRSINGAIVAWFAQHNDTIGGRKAVIIRRDDAHSPENARRLAQELIVQEKIDILLGGTSVPEALALGDVSTQAKVPYFIINATTPGVLSKAPYATRTSFLTADLAPPLAHWALRNGIKNVYAVYADYSTGTDVLQSLTDAMAAGGGKVIGSVAVPLNTTDYSSYLLRVKDAKPDAVFAFVGGGPASINLVKQFSTTGLKASGMKLIGTADLLSEELMAAQGDAAIGVVTVTNYTVGHTTKINRDFVRAYRAALPNVTPEDAPNFMTVQTWDALTAIDKAVAAQKGPIDAARTMEALRGASFQSPRGTITFDPVTREVHQAMYVQRAQFDGQHYFNAEIAAFAPGAR
jgi:branched-chain amino acid transport system substrate-binding protein